MRTLVVGAGVSGRAAAALALRLGDEVCGFDEDPGAATAMRDRGYEWADRWDETLLRDVDRVVTSPGVPPVSIPLADASRSGVPVWSELEFASRRVTAPMAAVTGTNGKTSAVTAAALMLEASGIKACAAGNIGTALSDVADEPWDAIVVEASSFQLHFIDTFRPSAAGILNIASDHLDWHGSRGAYVAAKARIVENQEAGDVVAYGADDPDAAAVARAGASRRLPISGSRVPRGGAGVRDGRIRLGDLSFPAPDLGPDFLEDLVLAAAVARHVGATETGIGIGLQRFRPGAHRRRLVGEWDGVRWVDDSKATNPHAAAASASGFPSVVLIAGGRSKGLDLSPMAGMPTVRRVVVIGESAPELLSVFGGDICEPAASMEDAVASADRVAAPGDTVLLAPGCASFDMFESYAHRGDAFATAVRARKGGA